MFKRSKVKALFSVLMVLTVALSAITLPGCQKKGEIKIGAIVPLTGPFAAYGEPVHEGMLLAVEEINNAGGINGKKIKLIVEDDAGEPKNAVNAFNKLVNTDKVPIILGPLSSGCSMATAPVAEEQKVVQLSTLAGIPDLSGAGDYVFRIYPSSELGARFAAEEAIKRFNPEKVAILYMNNPFGQTSVRVYKETAQKMGVDVVATESFADGDQDFRTQLSKIKRADPDLLLCSAYWMEGANILVQMVELGLDIPVFGEDGWRGPIAEIVGEKGLENLYYADIAFGTDFTDNETMQNFIQAYEDEYQKKASTYAATGYEAVYVAKEAIEKGGYEATAIKNYLYRIDRLGALGHIKFDSNGDNVGVVFAIFRLNQNDEAILAK